MTPMKATDELYENNIRLDKMWLFPAWNGGDELADTLDLMVDSAGDLPAPLAALIKNWDDEELDLLFQGRDGSEFAEALDAVSAAAHGAGLSGFLAVFSTPVLTYTSETSASFSWGHTYHQLLFGETLEILIENAKTWAADKSAASKKRTWESYE
jgi:hypothetical protein